MSRPLRRALLPTALLLLPLAAGAGCGGGSSASPDASTGSAGTGSAGTGGAGSGGADPNAIVGTFVINLKEDPNATVITGAVKNGKKQELVIYEPTTKDGSCTLYKPRVPFCSPACASPLVCVEDDTCRAQPENQDVGTVTVKGLKTTAGGTSFELTKLADLSYSTAESLMFPPFDEGADVSIESTGGAYAPFSMHAKGIAPLIVPTTEIPIEKNKPLVLTWTPKGAASDATIHVMIDLSHHGGTKGRIECDVPDTGSLTIAATLVTPLMNLGFSGYPSYDITRSSVGTASLAHGKVQLSVQKFLQRYLSIPGLVSCTDDTDCPTGKTCQTDLQCK